MKRLFILFAVAVLAVSMMAKTTIQNTFMGLKLGQASQNEVQSVLSSQGFELLSDTGGFYMYQGNYQLIDVPIKNVITRFLNDTLILMMFATGCENKCDSLIPIIDTNVENRYGLLQDGDSSTVIKMFSAGMLSLNMKQWARTDGETSFLYAKSDSGYVFMYIAEEYLSNYFTKLAIKALMEVSPDYAEENKVTGVAGVKFGDSKETVRQVISTKAEKLLEADAHSLNYYEVKIGGITYKYATFYFDARKGLVSVNMQSSFYSWRKEEAEMSYENVAAQYKRKYTNFKVLKDEPDEKICICGAYSDDYDYKPILISFHKSLSRGGDIMYYIEVDYYFSKRRTLYDDEI